MFDITHCYEVEITGKIKTVKAERDQVKSVLPQSAKGTEGWGLKSQVEEFSR